MSFSRPADSVIFIDESLENEFNALKENDWLKKIIRRAIENFKENAFIGRRIRKKQIPPEYIKKYGINNLLWYPLPNAWRLVYTIITNKKELIVAIVEYSDHKNYERRFNY